MEIRQPTRRLRRSQASLTAFGAAENTVELSPVLRPLSVSTARVEGHVPAGAILRQRQVGDTPVEVDVLPAQTQKFAPPHAGLHCEFDQRTQVGHTALVGCRKQELLLVALKTTGAALRR